MNVGIAMISDMIGAFCPCAYVATKLTTILMPISFAISRKESLMKRY